MKALYAGSFDPFTIGHLDIAERALKMFDGLVIGVGYNENKKGEEPVESRVESIRRLFAGNSAVEVEAYSGLTVDYALKKGIGVLVRGVRNGVEFAKEKELADINREIGRLDTVILPALPQLAHISSSMVRELRHNGYPVNHFLP